MLMPIQSTKTAAAMLMERIAIFLLRRTFGFCVGVSFAEGSALDVVLEEGDFFEPADFALFDLGITMVSE